MKIQRLETHDRLLHFKENQSANIFQGAEDCLKKNPLSLQLQQHSDYIYLFAHPRTSDDGCNKRMLWQPRLIKPYAQTNSYLFRAIANTDIIEVCWLLPPRELWSQYEKGKVTENELVIWSIFNFENHRSKLEEPHAEDLDEKKCRNIYRSILSNQSKPKILV